MESQTFLNLRKFLVPEIVYRNGAIELSGIQAKNFGARKVFWVIDPGIVAAGWMEVVIACLKEAGIESIGYPGHGRGCALPAKKL